MNAFNVLIVLSCIFLSGCTELRYESNFNRLIEASKNDDKYLTDCMRAYRDFRPSSLGRRDEEELNHKVRNMSKLL